MSDEYSISNTDSGTFVMLNDKPVGIADAAHVYLSNKITELEKDKSRLDWLADINNNIGNVQLPTKCVTDNIEDMRAAIDQAMST